MILAGGEGRRAGHRDKGTLDWHATLDEALVRRRHCLTEAAPEAGVIRINLLQGLRRLGVMTPHPRLTLLTVGNTSNGRYALAGNGCNAAGTSYQVGCPAFRAE